MRNPVLATLVLVLAVGCATSRPSTPPGTGPTTTEPTASTATPPTIARWACSANIDPDGNQVSACWGSMHECQTSDVQADPPPGWTHSPCAATATAFCFDGDIIDDTGAVLVATVPYCFITAPDCEQTREIALADPGSATVTACSER